MKKRKKSFAFVTDPKQPPEPKKVKKLKPKLRCCIDCGEFMMASHDPDSLMLRWECKACGWEEN